jgi:hypothetical protein
MDDDNYFKDKATFAVSFVVLLLTLSTCGNTYLNNIVLDFFSYSFSALQLLFIMATILVISTYFSALVQLKYSTLKLTSWKVLTAFSLLADTTYALAILFPFLIVSMYFISILLRYISRLGNVNNNLINIITAIINICIAVIASLLTYHNSNIKRKETVSKISQDSDILEFEHLKNARDYFETDNYGPMLIELHTVIKDKLYVTLLKKYSLTNSKATFSELAAIAKENRVINSNQYSFIMEINILRNKAAHGMLEPPLDKNKAKQLLDDTEEFIDSFYSISYFIHKNHKNHS